MFLRRNTLWARGAVLFLVPFLLSWNISAGGGPSRAAGTDISVIGITSHNNGSIIDLSTQTVSALLRNEGSVDFPSDVNATLTVYYPANETSMSVVFTNTTFLGSILGQTGNTTTITFPGWTPMLEGFYAINVTANIIDDHPENNSANITVRAVTGSPEGLTIDVNDNWKVIKPGESTSDAPNTPYIFRVRNDGYMIDTFGIDVESDWLEPGWQNSTGPLDPGEWSDNIMVNVKAPSDARPGIDFDILVFTATSENDRNISEHIAVETKLLSKSGVSVVVISEDPMVAYPGGDWVDFNFLVQNTGDRTDDFKLEVKTRPTTWDATLGSELYIHALQPGHSRLVSARIRVPPLDYDTMEKDQTMMGDTGALVLKASSPMTLVEGTGEGHVYVGLVHTVQMEIDPPNRTLGWDPNVLQNVTFHLNITSVNNIRDGVGVEMDVNMSLPEGPYGVQFYPLWDSGRYNDTESRRWAGGVAPRALHLESGETSYGSRLEVSAPAFPFQGAAVAVVEATPLLGEGVEGLALPARVSARVFVQPELQFSVEPPRTEFFERYRDGLTPVDVNGNSVPDWQEGAPGDVLELPFNITNTGNTADAYDVFADAIPNEPSGTLPDDWDVQYLPRTDVLIPFWYNPLGTRHSRLVRVMVRIPDGAPIGESANVKVEVTSLVSRDTAYSPIPLVIVSSIDIFVIQGFGLDLEPEESSGFAAPDETVEYHLNVTNTGNGPDSVKFIPDIGDAGGWEVDFNISDIDLEPLQRQTITLFVTPSADASADDVLAIRVRAVSLFDPSTYDDVWVNTTVRYVGGAGLELLSDSQLVWKYPGEIATFRMEITNTGNGNDTFQLDLGVGVNSWAGMIDAGDHRGISTTLDIERGGKRSFKVNISVPSLLQAQSYSDLQDLMILAHTRIENNLTVYPRGDPEKTVTEGLTVGVLQQYRSDLALAPSEVRTKNVLVGEQVIFRLVMRNTGNGEDNLTALRSSPTGSVRQIGWTNLDPGPYLLAPFSEVPLNLSVEPDPEGSPLFDERIDVIVEAVAGNGITYRRTNLSVKIVMSRPLAKMTEVDLGTEGELRFRICNMPAPGSTPRPGFPDQKTFNISSEIDTQASDGSGWSLTDPSFDVTLVDPYQLADISVPIRAPPDLLDNPEYISVKIEIWGSGGMYSFHTTIARAVYFDAAVDVSSTRFQNMYEGRTGKAYIRMLATGTRSQESIPLVVRVGGRTIGTFEAGPANPQSYAGGEQEIILTVDFDLPTLRWYEKGRTLDFEVMVDPDNEIVENTIAGNGVSESNNRLEREFVIKNYTPGIAVLVLSGLLLLFSAVAGIVGFFYMDKRNSWFLLLLSVGLTGLFAMLFYLPIEESGPNLGMANGVGLGIILVDIFLIMPIMVYLYTRAGDAYIAHLMKERTDMAVAEGREVSSSVLKPLFISLIGGILIILVPALFWVVPSEMNRGAGGIVDALMGSGGGIPVWVPVLIIPLFSVGLQLSLLQFKRSALKRIESTWDSLERLKTEIEEGFG